MPGAEKTGEGVDRSHLLSYTYKEGRRLILANLMTSVKKNDPAPSVEDRFTYSPGLGVLGISLPVGERRIKVTHGS